jgi:hypothetical protein
MRTVEDSEGTSTVLPVIFGEVRWTFTATPPFVAVIGW